MRDLKEHFVNEKELDEKIKAGDIKPVHIPKLATFSDIAKYHFVNLIVKYKKENDLKQIEIATMIDVNKSEVSKLFAYNLKEFSQERILSFLEMLIEKGADINLDSAYDKIKLQSAKLRRKLSKGENSMVSVSM